MFQDSYILVIETDTYAEIFLQEITAYCTGITSEYDEDQNNEQFLDFCEKNKLDPNMFEEIVNSKYPTGSDEIFVPQPYSIDQNENGEFNNVLIYMNKKPSTELLNIIKERAIEFSKNYEDPFAEEKIPLNILGIKLLVQETRIEEELSL